MPSCTTAAVLLVSCRRGGAVAVAVLLGHEATNGLCYASYLILLPLLYQYVPMCLPILLYDNICLTFRWGNVVEI